MTRFYKRCFFLVALALCLSASAKDRYDRPELTVPKDAAVLTLDFADAVLWDGKHIPRTMQCKALGGDNPASPALLVKGAPQATQSLVVFFANPREFHNHGLVKVTDGQKEGLWLVPAIPGSGLEQVPGGVEIFDGGSRWGVPYSPPCPTRGSWLYTVTVYALDPAGQVMGMGTRELGYAP